MLSVVHSVVATGRTLDSRLAALGTADLWCYEQ
jgi:hypothetical protein